MLLPKVLNNSLISMGLLEDGARTTGIPLTGGVSSDVWRADLTVPICVKRALEQLKVTRDWRVPVDRNAYEMAWFKVVADIVPQSVPKILGHDPRAGVFAMEYFPPELAPVWKDQLRNGVVESQTVQALADILCRIHGATAGDDKIASQFDSDKLFYSLRLEPYLYATAESHPDVAKQLGALAESLQENKKVLVHGDFSPKNILISEQGPIILDAECAWYGDPAFDAAFFLNHLLLKSIWNPPATARFLGGFNLFFETYLAGVSWENPAELEARVARLLPGLMLARIDGKSPVEYIETDSDKDRVRKFARKYLLEPTDSLEDLSASWLVIDCAKRLFSPGGI